MINWIATNSSRNSFLWAGIIRGIGFRGGLLLPANGHRKSADFCLTWSRILRTNFFIGPTRTTKKKTRTPHLATTDLRVFCVNAPSLIASAHTVCGKPSLSEQQDTLIIDYSLSDKWNCLWNLY